MKESLESDIANATSKVALSIEGNLDHMRFIANNIREVNGKLVKLSKDLDSMQFARKLRPGRVSVTQDEVVVQDSSASSGSSEQ